MGGPRKYYVMEEASRNRSIGAEGGMKRHPGLPGEFIGSQREAYVTGDGSREEGPGAQEWDAPT